MCVIICKPAGAEIPSSDLLKKAYMHNPHGCGLVAPSASYKGLSFNSFMKHIRECKVEEPLLIHFRYATHGSIKKSNCHPFYNEETNTHFMHNGVLHGITIKGDKTDSETAFNNILVPGLKKHDISSEEFKNLVYSFIGASKFAFLQDGKEYLFGNFTCLNGLYFSNLRFL